MQPLEFLRDLFGGIDFNSNKSNDNNYNLWISIFSVLDHCESIEIDYICDHLIKNKKYWKDSLVALPGTWFSNCPPNASKILKSLGWDQIPSYNEVKFSFIHPGSYFNKSISKNIKIENSFLILRTPLTVKDWRLFDNNLNYFDRDASEDQPIDRVSWIDSLWYCNQLSIKSKLDSCFVLEDESGQPRNELKYQDIKFLSLNCNGYRLPTQIEWEYACLSSIENKDRYAGLNESAWWNGNSNHQIQKVAQKKPNLWGLYDMLGNVNEWCLDEYSHSSNMYSFNFPEEHSQKIQKGGDYRTNDDFIKIFKNHLGLYDCGFDGHGFRPVRTIVCNHLYDSAINQKLIDVNSNIKIENGKNKLISRLDVHQKEKIKNNDKFNLENKLIDEQIYSRMYENQYQTNDALQDNNQSLTDQDLTKNKIVNHTLNNDKNIEKIKTLTKINEKTNDQLPYNEINSGQSQIVDKNSIQILNEQLKNDSNNLNLNEQFKNNVSNLNILSKSTESNVNNLNLLLKSTENDIKNLNILLKSTESNVNSLNLLLKSTENNINYYENIKKERLLMGFGVMVQGGLRWGIDVVI